MRCPAALNLLLTLVFIVLAIPLAMPTLRRKLISDGVLGMFRKVMPPMSQTEREALEAGTVWWDGELFSGRPDWQRLLVDAASGAHRGGAALPRRGDRSAVRDDQRLGDHQRLQGPAAARLAIRQGQGLPRHDHPEGVWRPRILGLAHSQVMTKLSTRCGTARSR
jgi:acyl-CoA dehydrogenase